MRGFRRKLGRGRRAYTSYIKNEMNPVWEGERLQLKLYPGGERPLRLQIQVWDKDMQTPDDMIAAGEVVLDDVDAKVAGVQGTRTLRLKGVDDDDEEVEEFGFSYTLLAEEEPKQATKRSSLTGPPKGGVPKAPPATPKKAAPAAPAKGKKK